MDFNPQEIMQTIQWESLLMDKSLREAFMARQLERIAKKKPNANTAYGFHIRLVRRGIL
jgi:hypothetical protein